MKIIINNKRKDNITFGLFFFIFFIIITVYPLVSGGSVRIWSAALSLVFLIITIVNPNLFTIFNKLWIQFGAVLGKIISPIVMLVVFFLVITPIGIFLRLLNKDILRLKKGGSSYWIHRENKLQNMKKQF